MTRDEARAEVIDAIEANGTDIATGDEYDVDAIVDTAYAWSDTRGYRPQIDATEFWRTVERHAVTTHRRNPS